MEITDTHTSVAKVAADAATGDVRDRGSLSHVGASAPPTLRRRAHQKLGSVIAHTYGTSEEGLVSLLSPLEHDPARPERFPAPAGSFRSSKSGCADRMGLWRISAKWVASKFGHPRWRRDIAIDQSSKPRHSS